MGVGFALWLVVIFCGLLLLLMAGGIFLFVIRRQTIIRIFMPDRSLYVKRYFFRKIPKEINLGKDLGIYIIDERTFYKSFFGNVYHFTYNNPNPIDEITGVSRDNIVCKYCNSHDFINVKTNKSIDIKPSEYTPSKIGYRAQDLSIVHDNKLLKDLFSVENLDRAIMMVCIITLLVVVIILIFSIIKKIPPVELSTTGNNTQLIKMAVREAIRAGG